MNSLNAPHWGGRWTQHQNFQGHPGLQASEGYTWDLTLVKGEEHSSLESSSKEAGTGRREEREREETSKPNPIFNLWEKRSWDRLPGSWETNRWGREANPVGPKPHRTIGLGRKVWLRLETSGANSNTTVNRCLRGENPRELSPGEAPLFTYRASRPHGEYWRNLPKSHASSKNLKLFSQCNRIVFFLMKPFHRKKTLSQNLHYWSFIRM